MKKLLSVILAVAMIMSLFCALPASAESINTWPYFFEDFEDNASSVQGSPTVVEGGAGGSKYAGQFTVPATDNGSIKFFVGSATNLIKTGDTFKATADIKLSTAISKSSGTLHLHYTGAKTANSPNAENFPENGFLNIGTGRPTWSFDNTSTEWQKVSFEGVYTGLDVRVDGSMGISFLMSSTGTEYTYMIDNVEIQIIRDTFMDSEPATRVIYENDFSKDMSGFTYTGTTAEGSGLSVTEDGVLQMVDTDSTKQSENGHVKLKLNVGEALKTNKYYLLTYKTRIVEATDNSSSTPTTFGTGQTSKHRWTFDNSLMFEENSQIKCNGYWAYVKILFNYSSDTKETFEDGVFDFRWWIKYDGTGSDTATYEFDDFKFEEVGGLVDGDWEYRVRQSEGVNGTTVVYKEVDETSNSDVLTGVAPTLNAWSSVSGGSKTINYNLNTSTKTSGKNSATLYFYKIDGTAYHKTSLALDAGQKYNLSAMIRPEENSAGTLEFGINYTYTDGTAANSVKIGEFATKASDGTNRVFSKYTTPAFTAPANIATAELYVKQIDKVGEDQNIDRLYGSSANLAYYTDDWAFAKLPSDNIPTVTASATTAAGGVVSVAKNTTAPTDVTVTSVVKLTATNANGVKSYIGSTTGTAITVPEAYRTGYTLAAEITPVASNGYIGKTITIEVPEVPAVTETTFTATAADGATLASGEDMSGKVIWAAYDVNGLMLDWSSAPISVTAGNSATVSVPEDFSSAGAKEVKVMLWQDMINCLPLADAVTY